MKVIYLNVVDRKAPEVLDVDDELETYQRLIGCDCIDIVRREIGGKPYRIICDDEGYFKKDAFFISAVSNIRGNCPLVGNLVICGDYVKDGELTGLTKKEEGLILQEIRFSPIAGHYMLIMSA